MSVAVVLAAGALLCPGPAGAQQLVTVQAKPGATVAALALWRRSGACLRRVAGPWTANLGAAGLSTHKHGGDDATPTGTYRIGGTVYGTAPNPGLARLAYHRLVCGDWWDEDPGSPTYNRFRHVACGTQPSFGGSSEALWRITPQYRYFAVIDYNASPVVPGRGSAVFMHVSTGRPTAGCVSLPEETLLRVLRWLRPGALVRLTSG